ncbi:DUF221-domain-containing protein [Eremomyces bilateralis CBS 781.70]|uniref:DUF221-domain-containing protein n=1 Tax=Eremomyces bilateralis CBS 781.70 TaxID=1392243 RepID=A0A6G1G1F7_9PEZI|nr:DUF221-domain-containing protein [Eremomyces bilateralis CBS 781.70]KAF1811766.1 DUF221-domain-containing protein [Eremomyces bilateralis CBS 781.70]
MADTPESTSTSLANPFTSGGGQGQEKENISFAAFVASLATALVVFSIELLAFFILKGRFARIYAPRTFLVPKRERIAAAPSGLIRWIIPVLKTSNSEFIHKCGLDAYLFLRYLRMLLKIFLPLALVILPILLPLNSIGTHTENTSGMDLFGWQNVGRTEYKRFWAHLCLAILVIIYVCYTFYDELRKYVRLRQAYLTSPQHRLRASATTVLVSNIPHKWLTEDALGALYDVFPGGVRNIWINRNFDELSEKVAMRDKYAKILESAETVLIQTCVKKHAKIKAKELKAAGVKRSRSQRKRDREAEDAQEQRAATHSEGISAGNPHQIPESIEDAVRDGMLDPGEQKTEKERKLKAVPVIGEGLNAIGRGFETVGRGFGKAGGVVFAGLKRGGKGPTNAEDNPYRESYDLDDEGYSVRYASSDRPLRSQDGSDPHRDGLGQDGVDEPEKQGRPSEATVVDPHADASDFGTHARAPTRTNPSLNEKDLPKTTMKRRVTTYPTAYDALYDPTDHPEVDIDAAWRKYLKPKDRETMRLPLFNKTWCPSIPLLGKKVDTIYYARRRLAQLNAEIEKDQQHPEDFPKMSSAFIQFNHQVAAHMACQALSHHIPKHMAPRVVEIAPKDVIWDNLSVKWWEGMIRTGIVIVSIVGIIIAWALPISVTGLLSQVNYLTETFKFLNWMNDLPKTVISIIQGILPPLFLAILLALLPVILRLLARLQGIQTGMQIEQTVQNYYFAFLFIQVFLIVSISSSIGATVEALISNPLSVPQTLASNLPKSSNYFFSYMILQALTVSAGALMQIGGLIQFFLLAPILDSTARQKWQRQLQLTKVPWGTFFPVYTNLAAIGIIYSVISPLILVFNIITFSLFWIVYRYQTLYVFRFELDTGGLLFPRAVNQLFTGVYVMELCLVGLFLLAQTPDNNPACLPQAIIMVVFLALTILYQYLLNDAFGPLFRYIPITMEDDAVRRDEEFERANGQRWELDVDETVEDNIQVVLEQRERNEEQEDKAAEAIELAQIEKRKSGHTLDPLGRPISLSPGEYDGHDEKETGGVSSHPDGPRNTTSKPFKPTTWGSHPTRKSWADRSDPQNRRLSHHAETAQMPAFLGRRPRGLRLPTPPNPDEPPSRHEPPSRRGPGGFIEGAIDGAIGGTNKALKTVLGNDGASGRPLGTGAIDIEAQGPDSGKKSRIDAIGDLIYGNYDTALEDMTPEERDKLVNYAFRHKALRAVRPCVWVPRDGLGVADDEIRRTQRLSQEYIWISNERARVDKVGNVRFGGAPPDQSPVDMIQL